MKRIASTVTSMLCLAIAAGAGPRKCKPEELCSMQKVILDLGFPGSIGDESQPVLIGSSSGSYQEGKDMVEQNTWLHVVGTVSDYPSHDSGIGTLIYSRSTGGIEAHSSNATRTSTVGSEVTSTLTLRDANGKILWTLSERDLEGVVGSSSFGGSEAHEVHARSQMVMLEDLLRALGKSGKLCKKK